MQKEIYIKDSYSPLLEYIDSLPQKKPFLVCDGSYGYLNIKTVLDNLGGIIRFSEFTPNPDYEAVKKAVESYRKNGCDYVIAVGGGSALDLAKCVRAYVTMADDKEFLEQTISENGIPFIAVPTTAGTGSEATRYAVIYYEGNKQSITDNSLIPKVVVFDPSALGTLPGYQRRATMLDALCHSMESYWSVNSTDESKGYSKQALRLILDNMDGYLLNRAENNAAMLKAANLAGKAINITQTTAGHAMCYKLTSLYGIAHGQAAAMCVSKLLPYMISHTEKCVDARGEAYLKNVFEELAHAMDCKDTAKLCAKFDEIYNSLQLAQPKCANDDIKILSASVNPVRLKNNPVALDTAAIEELYKEILL